MSKSGSQDERKSLGRVDGENVDRRIIEVCQLYGFDEPECARQSFVRKDGGGGDADSVVSEDSDEDSVLRVPLQDRVDSRLYAVRETGSGQELWRCPIEDSDTIAGHIAAMNGLSHRLPCHSFRSMLPPLEGGAAPTRGPGWLACCVRGVLLASLWRFLEDRQRSRCVDHADRLRFPEFVYCWFDDGDEGEHQSSPDKDRWAFYCNLKLSADADPECWLAYHLLDDMHGEEFFSFLARVVEDIRKRMGDSWDRQLGEVLSSEETVGSCSRLLDANPQHGCCLGDDRTCLGNVWMPVEICEEVIDELFRSDQKIESSEHAEELSKNVYDMSLDIENSIIWVEEVESPSPDEIAAVTSEEDSYDAVPSDAVPLDAVTPCVGLFAFLQMIMKSYLSRREKQLTLIKLMFDTASRGVLTDFYDAPEGDRSDEEDLVNVPQLHQILGTIWPSATLEETTLIYREAYDALYPPSQWGKPAPDGINFQAFLIAAERRCLFSRASVNFSRMK